MLEVVRSRGRLTKNRYSNHDPNETIVNRIETNRNLSVKGLLTTVICHSPASFLIIELFSSFSNADNLGRKNQMRAAVLTFILSMTLQLCAQQQAPPATSADKSIPINPVSQNSPCADQPKSLGELIASFNEGRAPSAKELVGVWVEIGDFNSGMRPLSGEAPAHFRSLNCTGITRGKKFEFAMIGVSYSYVMELHAYGSSGAERQRMEPNHKGGVEFSIDLLADGAEAVFTCRLTQRGTLACTDGDSGSEFRKMKVAESQLFGVFRP